MSASSTVMASVAVVVAVAFASTAAAVPGTLTAAAVNSQTCSKGCVAGLLVLAGIVAVFGASLMCFIFWPALELTTRQEKRAAARKRIRERKEAEEEARAKNEALEGHDM
ncbi:hypothetical protein NESM_000617700 [Novymonas esmeraldas]|uniref:Transmembrane protein n=1 Tax=Novymonas esmeraldas TaxID=1808958 RepID=A0AAW0ETD4_9TRYP